MSDFDVFVYMNDGYAMKNFCSLCRCFVPDSPFSKNQHINGSQHQNNLADDDGTIEGPDNRNRMYCQRCDCYIPNHPYNINEHLKGNRHSSNQDSDSNYYDSDSSDSSYYYEY